MTLSTTVSPEQTVALLGVASEDAQSCLALFAGPPSPAVLRVLSYLSTQLGAADDAVPELGTAELPVTELDWINGFLRFVPDLLSWHQQRHIPETVTRATLADFGRNLAINRRVHQRFGMDTYKWLTHAFSGRLFQLGRLQFLLHQPQVSIPGVGRGEWILGIHIPEDGGLAAGAVQESMRQAVAFFAAHFPDKPVRTANCESWLLDPYLRERLAPTSNIARFADLFTPYGEPREEPTDAVYFTFRTRSMNHLEQLPRTTALQGIVLDRIAGGGSWHVGSGTLGLPD